MGHQRGAPEIDAWDIELLLAVKGLTCLGSSASRPCSEYSSPSSRGAARARLAANCGRIRRDVENSQARSDDWVPGVHGHHSGVDRLGAFR